ncbi:zinc finger and BTB domain-containing protein 1 [Protopterus annectens]|uniref:zinc finger and BTB domain-containing protein 1 n=1 Tax=Protopterus annectens TaxID=7888 RepID=UPI001CFBE962|nr:zinc finger and BTB domain-containing protein 1 [Protopterus annectens]XP_043930316.1 zinc finger and BTB domain-containing protein 1 [Protopterus annectens]
MPRPNHSDYVLLQLHSQREWGFLCDCCIAINDIYFRAHKAVLAACSSYFRMIFINHQHITEQLNLSNMKISAEYFDLILQFMYLGKIMTAPSNFEEFKAAMAYLQLYYIPESLDEIRDTDSTNIKYFSSFLSNLSNKMIFGVRMYEDKRTVNVEGTSRWCPEQSLMVKAVSSQEPEEAVLHAGKFHDQPYDLCKKHSGPKAPNPKERVARRFGKSYTCDGCGFVFSCEKLLDEHMLTCTNAHSFQKLKADCTEKTDLNKSESLVSISSLARAGRYLRGKNRITEAQITLTENSLNNHSVTERLSKDNDISEEKNAVVIKVEPEDVPAADLSDINVVKVPNNDSDDSAENEDFEDDDEEEDEHEHQFEFYADEEVSGKSVEESMKIEFPNKSDSKERDNVDERNVDNTSKVLINQSCELCGMALPEDDLSSHYISSHIGSICACGKCGQILVKGRQLQEHAETCGEPQDLAVNGYGNEDPKNACRISSAEQFVERFSAIKKTGISSMPEDTGSNFKTKSLLKSQIYKHVACPYRCPHCGQRFETESLFMDHMPHCMEQDIFKSAAAEDHEKDHRRKHFCNICSKGFYQRCHLREHYTVHTKEKQFVCQICGKQFLRERQLRLHNDMHKGMARYICPICEQGNFRKHDHVRHMTSHLSAGQTICQVCFEIFTNSEELQQHMDSHLYVCGVCGAKFNLRKDMRHHYNVKHLKRI